MKILSKLLLITCSLGCVSAVYADSPCKSPLEKNFRFVNLTAREGIARTVYVGHYKPQPGSNDKYVWHVKRILAGGVRHFCLITAKEGNYNFYMLRYAGGKGATYAPTPIDTSRNSCQIRNKNKEVPMLHCHWTH